MAAGAVKDLWSRERRPRKQAERTDGHNSDPRGVRSVFQQDYDRLLFSTPDTRLADKTQVWPMDENDGVRTRLQALGMRSRILARWIRDAGP